jgi:hypothetical protein
MYEMVIEFFVARPGRLSALGRFLFQLSAMILLVGLCGRIATAGVSAIQGMAGAMPRQTSLAALYPSLPTWWVPESFFGYVACVLMAVISLALVHMGKAADRAIS